MGIFSSIFSGREMVAQAHKKNELLQIENENLRKNYDQLTINYNQVKTELSELEKHKKENGALKRQIGEIQHKYDLRLKREDERFGRLIRILNSKGIHLTDSEINDLTP